MNLNPPDIFLSYNREDQAIARRFAEGFEREGLSVWWDATLRSGEAYDQITEAALRTAKAVVVLWSTRSVNSRWVRAEATLADRNRTLVPARIEPCDLPIMFELTQTADLLHWSGEPDDPAWQAFVADVRQFVDAGTLPERPAPAPDLTTRPMRGMRPSIAVLPFINRSGLPEDDVFADGMVEDLTVALSLSRRMKVIAASATAAYRAGARDLRRIGSDLGVRYLLEGNVRRVGDDLRVTAQLVEAGEGDILWTQKFDRPLAELAALQEQLATEVAAFLGIEVQRAEMEHALRKPGDITAWEAVLRAEANISRQTASAMETAVAEARRAIAIDPEYDVAHATLVIALGMLYTYRGGNDAGLERELRETVARVRKFEPNDPIVLARVATGLLTLGKLEEALPYAERAVALNPNLEIPRIALGSILGRLGRWDDSIAELNVADQLAPNGIWAHGPSLWRSVAYFHTGRVEKALEGADQAVRFVPSSAAQVQRIICLASLNRWEEARDAMRRLRGTHPFASWEFVENFLRIGRYYGATGDVATVMRRLWDETEATDD